MIWVLNTRNISAAYLKRKQAWHLLNIEKLVKMELIQHTINWVKGEILEAMIMAAFGALIIRVDVANVKFHKTSKCCISTTYKIVPQASCCC